VAAYIKEAGDLWAYLDENPERAHACLGTIFEDFLAADVRETLEPLTDDELARVDRLRQTMEKVVGILLVPDGADISVDELSHLVYDPFPAPLTVRLPGPPLEEPEGFMVADGGRTLTAAGPGLFQAFEALAGRWLTPDPALLCVQMSRRRSLDETLDLDAVLAQPRRADLASADEIRQAVEEQLRPVPLYRVTFAVQPDVEPTPEEIGW
jgi:hypothetical protein